VSKRYRSQEKRRPGVAVACNAIITGDKNELSREINDLSLTFRLMLLIIDYLTTFCGYTCKIDELYLVRI
jgi:hypothetical protein